MDHRAITRIIRRQFRARARRRACVRGNRWTRAESGQATLEFAIISTIFLMIVIGILYFGRLLNYSIQATHLANEAVRDAAVDFTPGPGTLNTSILGQATGELKNPSGDVTNRTLQFCFPNGTSAAGSDPVQATVTFKMNFLPFLNVGPAINVTQTATMLIEEPQSTSVYTVDATCP